MTAASHASVLTGMALTSLVAVACAHPRWVVHEIRRHPVARALLNDGVRRSADEEELHARNALYQRFVAKRTIAQQLIRGERTLLEAAEAFAEINRHCRSTLLHSRAPDFVTRTAATDPLTLCEQVLFWVGDELTHQRDPRAGAVLGRLRAELQQIRSRLTKSATAGERVL